MGAGSLAARRCRYPVSLPMRGRLAVVIGGGGAAAQRVAGLRAAGAEVVVVGRELSVPLADLASAGRIRARRRGYWRAIWTAPGWCWPAADQATVNAAIAADAERHRIWCIRAAGTGSESTRPAAGHHAGHHHAGRRHPRAATTARPACGVLVLGGARSGKSAVAEAMLAGQGTVDYVATGPLPGTGDAEWDARVADHRQRRPAHWRTAETLDLDQVLGLPDSRTPVLIDCLSTWLARLMDDCGLWSGRPGADRELAARVDRLVAAWQTTRRPAIAVSNEVGSGVVPATKSGRRYRDELDDSTSGSRPRAGKCGSAPRASLSGCDETGAPGRALAGRPEPVHGDTGGRAGRDPPGDGRPGLLWLPVLGGLLGAVAAGALLAVGRRPLRDPAGCWRRPSRWLCWGC